VLLYDNLKSAVLERQGDAIRFNPILLAFASHYRFEPRPVAVARGNEKGRVERAIRYVRDNFFPARVWNDIDDLNQQAIVWCEGIASDRPCPEEKTQSVRDVFLQEQSRLLSLPDDRYPTHERVEVSVAKTPYVRFDLNDYSVPCEYVRRSLTVCATPDIVSIIDGTTTLATHARSYDKGQQIEDPLHVKTLVERKTQARVHRGQQYLTKAVPVSLTLLIQAAECGYKIGAITSQLLRFLDEYGATALELAINESLARGSPHPNTVRLLLEKQRVEKNQLPPMPLVLPDDKRVREMIIKPHKLTDYDPLPEK